MDLVSSGAGAAAATRTAIRAGWVSVLAGAVIMLAKFIAWAVTGSSAVFADAAESVVNVIAAGMVTFSVTVAARPADQDHPYGHGKAEPLSAFVEGALILVAATFIIVQSIRELVFGPELTQLGLGIAIAGAAGLGNLLLGLYLIRVGRSTGSEALEADGQHVLTDVITTVGTLLALVLVRWTGIQLLDPLAALAVAANILWTGSRVMRRALGSLLDEADFPLLERLAQRLEAGRRPEWVEIHQLRMRASGSLTHVDLHLTVPRYLSVEEAHRIADALESEVDEVLEGQGDSVVHLDPCAPRQCPTCAVSPCPIRAAPLEGRLAFDVEQLVRPGLI